MARRRSRRVSSPPRYTNPTGLPRKPSRFFYVSKNQRTPIPTPKIGQTIIIKARPKKLHVATPNKFLARLKKINTRSTPKPIKKLNSFINVINNPLICAKRKIRSQIMHAINKAGKTGQKKPRFNSTSNISC